MNHRIVIAVGTFVLLAALAANTEAGWGRYRVTTYYGTPSVPVVQEAVVVGRPVVLVPAPMVVAPAPVTAYYYNAPVTSYYSAPVTSYYSAPVTAYYGSPSLYVGPRGVVRAAYYAPAPRTYYYAPAPATYILP